MTFAFAVIFSAFIIGFLILAVCIGGGFVIALIAAPFALIARLLVGKREL